MISGIKNLISRFFSSEKKKFKVALSKIKGDVKLIVGAGMTEYNEWISSEKHQLNVLSEKDWVYFFGNRKLTNILAEHVWEHLSLTDAAMANALCYKYLSSGGRLRLAVPDGFFPDKNYIDYVKPGGTGAGADDHKVLYNYKLMKEQLEKVGFKVELLEYWDEEGQFHFTDWDPQKGGMIDRSKRFDERNKNGQLKYTSLIVDAIKA